MLWDYFAFSVPEIKIIYNMNLLSRSDTGFQVHSNFCIKQLLWLINYVINTLLFESVYNSLFLPLTSLKVGDTS